LEEETNEKRVMEDEEKQQRHSQQTYINTAERIYGRKIVVPHTVDVQNAKGDPLTR